jgi:AraC-like DNA-binding protein
VQNVGTSLTAADLAAMTGMRVRSLARLFVREAGVTPHDFVERARVDVAGSLLEGSEKPMKVVAYECGFGSAGYLRTVFSKLLGPRGHAHAQVESVCGLLELETRHLYAEPATQWRQRARRPELLASELRRRQVKVRARSLQKLADNISGGLAAGCCSQKWIARL